MKNGKLLIAIMIIVVGSIAAKGTEQKSENYGYFETTAPNAPKVTTDQNTGSMNMDVVDRESPNVSGNSLVNEKSNKVEMISSIGEQIDHSAFDALLKNYVNKTGNVDYKGIKSNVKELDNYLGYLSQNVPSANAEKNEVLAFWINAYNANTIKLIVDNYPVKSIMDLYGGKAFDKKWISVGGETLSLNDIENNKIRAKFNEPRIHFAVNCAAKSCPPILNKAWTADNLEKSLEARALAFVNDTAYNKISVGAAQISKIFEWYAKDFPKDIVSYLNKYSKTTLSSGAKISYVEYDWALNSQ